MEKHLCSVDDGEKNTVTSPSWSQSLAEFKSSNERRARCFLRLDDDQDNSENAGKKGGGNPTDVLTQ